MFTSQREKRLWFWTLVALVAIYSLLGFAGKLAQFLRDQNLLSLSFGIGFFLAVVAILGSGLRMQFRRCELWVSLGIVVVYGMVAVRLFITPEERTHLFEYGIVAALIYQALLERQDNGRYVLSPVLLAIIATALLGWLDEGIQAILPNRVYDIRDVGFNALAGFMAVMTSIVLNIVRKRFSR